MIFGCVYSKGLNGSKTLAPWNPSGALLIKVVGIESKYFYFHKKTPSSEGAAPKGFKGAIGKPP